MTTKTAEEQHQISDLRGTELYFFFPTAQSELPASLRGCRKFGLSGTLLRLSSWDLEAHKVFLSSAESAPATFGTTHAETLSSTIGPRLLQVNPAGLQYKGI